MTCYEIDNVKNIYDIIAPEFNQTRGYYWQPISDFINELPNNSLIYDIGCGNGRNMTYNNHTFIGIDNCQKFVDICKNKGLNAICNNMTDIQLASDSTDFIICIASFHHLSNKENRLKSLLEMKRLIKSGGKILLTIWSKTQPKKTRVTFDNYGDNIVYWKNIHPRYYYIFAMDEIKGLFNEAGLNIKSHEYDCGNEVFVLQK
jgi:SAM-dependent methyltransferase